MATNIFEINIIASVESVWKAITNAEQFSIWMKNVTVQTDWKKGSPITYTCYDENGKVMIWDGIQMIWEGVITSIIENKEFKCEYPGKNTGLIAEDYFLEKISEKETKLIQVQTLVSQEVADGYKDGVEQTLYLLKLFLEKR